jgi:hypothetical protein
VNSDTEKKNAKHHLGETGKIVGKGTKHAAVS